MLQQRAPLIFAGQLYLNSSLNEYMIVTKNTRGQVSYAGKGFRGSSSDCTFIEIFHPVNPQDVEPQEINDLLEFCEHGTKVSVGFIQED